MRKTFTTILALAGALFLAACGEPSADQKDSVAVDKQQGQYSVAQPVPQYDYSLERAASIELYNARNQNVATYTVWRSDFGQVLGDCPSVGYPIPYDASLTNPIKIGRRYLKGGGYSYHVVEQAEPNGLYSSKNSIATWIRCVVDVDGVPTMTPIYIEDRVTAYPYPVEVDYETDRVTRAGAPSVTLSNTPGK